jgi:hypothetical protein
MRRFNIPASLAICSILLVLSSLAQQTSTITVPNLIRYGGTLKDAQGTALASSTVGVTFAIYNQQDGGAPMWMETQNVTTDAGGNYSALLGRSTATGLPADLFSQQEQRWLGVQVQGQTEQARVLMVSVPYAFKAHEAETFGGKTPSDFMLANNGTSAANSGAAAVSSTTNVPPANGVRKGAASDGPTNFSGSTTDQIVGVMQSGTGDGIVASAPTLGIKGTATAPSGTAYGVQGVATGTSGVGLIGTASSTTGFTYGLRGTSSSTSGTGVRGVATATTGSTIGLSGYVDSSAGTAGVFNNAAGGKIVSLQNNGAEKFAVDGSGNVTTSGSINTSGLSGTTSAPTGVGLTGNATNTTGENTGVMGESASTNGLGVAGYANATTGSNAGVFGQSNSNAGWGVYGEENASTGQAIGVEGWATSSGQNSSGVLGYQASASGVVFGVSGQTNSTTTNASGLSGYEGGTTGQVYGVSGSTNSTTNNAAGISGYEGATSGQVFGVIGSTASQTNYAAGVDGAENATSGAVFGVNGYTPSTSNGAAGVNGNEGATSGVVYGVSGSAQSTTTNAAAVWGYESAATGQVYGVAGNTQSSGQYAAGVSGYAAATTGEVFGVTGSTNSVTSGASGVEGHQGATSGGPVYGVSGYAESTGGIGVFGSASATSGYAVGVEGATNSPGGTAGEFVNVSGSGMVLQGQSGSGYTTVFTVDASGNGHYNGNLSVGGTLSKGGGSFKIDDPLDPENKTLSHSFVESPDMLNIYNGSVRLDARGEGWVTMPEYFQALNRDFQYVLTSVGSSQPRLYIAREIKGNRFKIAGGRANGRVSWMVTGIRQDAWANAHRIPTEEVKPAQERGKYLHPELYGVGADKNTDAMLQH